MVSSVEMLVGLGQAWRQQPDRLRSAQLEGAASSPTPTPLGDQLLNRTGSEAAPKRSSEESGEVRESCWLLPLLRSC